MHIIALSGKKSAGKTTLSNFIHGHEMKRHDIIDKFLISPEGHLVVNCTFHDENGKEFQDMGVLDLNQDSPYFEQYASRSIWPLIKSYNFADSLKDIAINLFGLKYEQVFGTNDQKNSIVPHLLWENMPGVITLEDLSYASGYETSSGFSMIHDIEAKSEEEQGVSYWDSPKNWNPEKLNNRAWNFGLIIHGRGPMTAREFMQYFGTKICRKMYGPVWIENCFNRINGDGVPIAMIGDCRFTNEIEEVQKRGGKVIRLTRNPYNDTDESEVDADNYQNFDAVIDNANMTIAESTQAFLDILCGWGVTQKIRTISKNSITIR